MKWCPGGRATDVDHEQRLAYCPGCGYEFSTVMDDPVIPAHWIDAGDWVIFGPHDRGDTAEGSIPGSEGE